MPHAARSSDRNEVAIMCEFVSDTPQPDDCSIELFDAAFTIPALPARKKKSCQWRGGGADASLKE
jgi:hypothetical protein